MRYEEQIGGTGNVLSNYDEAHHEDILELGAPAPKARLMRSFDPALSSPSDVPDNF